MSCHRCQQIDIPCDGVLPQCSQCAAAKWTCSIRERPIRQPLSSANGTHFPPRDAPSQTASPGGFNLAARPSPDGDVNGQTNGDTDSQSDQQEYQADSVSPVGTAGEVKIKRTRRRACLSCVRCHRLKVKCDKKSPCTRCRSSGWGKQCEYTHRVEPSKGSAGAYNVSTKTSTISGGLTVPVIVKEEDPVYANHWWRGRPRGLSHWKGLAPKLGRLSSVMNHLPLSSVEQIKHRCRDEAYGALFPHNFPFSSPRAAPYMSIEKVHSLIYSYRDVYSTYINAYMQGCQPVHPIIDVDDFMIKLEEYWQDPSSSTMIWLSQFLMVLGLGHVIVTREREGTIELCMAAEACFSKTSYMLYPTLTTIRVFCLMILAKSIANATCWSVDGAWTLLGVVIRIAMSLDIHRSQPPPHATATMYQEWQSGRSLWMILIFLDIQLSMVTGMLPSISPADAAGKSENHFPSDAILDSADVVWRRILESTSSTILEIVHRVNSHESDIPTYEEVLEYNTEIRKCMGIMNNFRGPKCLQISIDMFLRQALLVLHRCYALEIDSPTRYPVSYWASLECSLALLVHQSEICERNPNLEGADFMFRINMLDVFCAALQVSIHLQRDDFPLAAGFDCPPRHSILETLRACVDLYSRYVGMSPCFRIGHAVIDRIVNVLSNRQAMHA